MLTPDQALKKIVKECSLLPVTEVGIFEALNAVLAKDVYSQDHLPRFDNSAVDGFAVRFLDIRGRGEKNPAVLKIRGESHAGSAPRKGCGLGEAIRISTGAPIPKGADMVLMQEECRWEGNQVWVYESEKKGGNIRRKGEEICRNQRVLKKGTVLTPGSLAWLNSMGNFSVPVIRPVQIGLLRSGNEVVEANRIQSYQIRDAHGVSIPLELSKIRSIVKISPIVPDRFEKVHGAMRKLFESSDVLLTTGGVSVGDRDLFLEAAEKIGVKVIFHKINQKPGKPLVFGRWKNKLWFGLPGNPVSSLVCLHVYVLPALRKMLGHQDYQTAWHSIFMKSRVQPDSVKTLFLRGYYNGREVVPAEKQGSHCMGSFAEANVLLKIPPLGSSKSIPSKASWMWLK